MSLQLASGAVRFKLHEIDRSTIGEGTKDYGKYALVTDKGYSFHSQKIDGFQEYLVKLHKMTSGILTLRITDNQYEISVVKKGFIENYFKISFDSATDNHKSIVKTIAEKIDSLVKSDFDGDKYKLVFNTRINDVDALIAKRYEGENDSLIIDISDAIPEKFQYVLAIGINKTRDNLKVLISVSAVLFIFIAYWLGSKFLSSQEEVEQKSVVVVNPYAEYYDVLYGKLPSVRQQLWLAYEMMENVETLTDRKLKTLTFTQRPDQNSMVISAELIPSNDKAKPDITSLIARVRNFEGNYMLDIQQQHPVLFREVKNIGAYDKANEDNLYSVQTNKESNVGIYNIDQTIAYLRDAINSIVGNARVVIPAATESARVSNGKYQQREIQISFEGNYKSDLDYLSVIFAGWPVVFVSGQLDGVDNDGRFTGQISLTILGDTN